VSRGPPTPAARTERHSRPTHGRRAPAHLQRHRPPGGRSPAGGARPVTGRVRVRARSGASELGLQLDRSALDVQRACGAEALHDAPERPVGDAGLGDEALDAVVAGGRGQLAHEHLAEPEPLRLVGDYDRDLGGVGCGGEADVARDPEAVGAVGRERSDGLVLVVVDVDEEVELVVAQVVDDAEEALVAAALAQMREALDEERAIGGIHGPDEDRRPVAEADGADGHAHTWWYQAPRNASSI